LQQDGGDSQEQLTHSNFRKNQDKMPATSDQLFPKVDVCTLFPNVFTPQQVTNDTWKDLCSVCNFCA